MGASSTGDSAVLTAYNALGVTDASVIRVGVYSAHVAPIGTAPPARSTHPIQMIRITAGAP